MFTLVCFHLQKPAPTSALTTAPTPTPAPTLAPTPLCRKAAPKQLHPTLPASTDSRKHLESCKSSQTFSPCQVTHNLWLMSICTPAPCPWPDTVFKAHLQLWARVCLCGPSLPRPTFPRPKSLSHTSASGDPYQRQKPTLLKSRLFIFFFLFSVVFQCSIVSVKGPAGIWAECGEYSPGTFVSSRGTVLYIIRTKWNYFYCFLNVRQSQIRWKHEVFGEHAYLPCKECYTQSLEFERFFSFFLNTKLNYTHL